MPKAKIKLTGNELKKLQLVSELSNCQVVGAPRKIAGEVQAIISCRSTESLVEFGKYMVQVSDADLVAFDTEKKNEAVKKAQSSK
jgi:hypothetical protein